jgi:hypothetical protein
VCENKIGAVAAVSAGRAMALHGVSRRKERGNPGQWHWAGLDSIGTSRGSVLPMPPEHINGCELAVMGEQWTKG